MLINNSSLSEQQSFEWFAHYLYYLRVMRLSQSPCTPFREEDTKPGVL